jgi:hypothetical protein
MTQFDQPIFSRREVMKGSGADRRGEATAESSKRHTRDTRPSLASAWDIFPPKREERRLQSPLPRRTTHSAIAARAGRAAGHT